MVVLSAPCAIAIVVLKVGASGLADPFPGRNGRQIARNQAGQWFLVYQGDDRGRTGTYLALSRIPDPQFQGDFHSSFLLISAGEDGVLFSGGGGVRQASLVIDEEDTLQRRACWTGPNGEGGSVRIGESGRDSYLGDVTLDPNGRLWVAYGEAVAVGPGYTYPIRDKLETRRYVLSRPEGYEIWMARLSPSGWDRRRLTDAGPARRPVMDLDPQGSLHLLFAGERSHLYYLRFTEFPSTFLETKDYTATPPQPLWSGTGYLALSVVGWGDRALVVFERTEHVPVCVYYDRVRWNFQAVNPTQEIWRNPILVRDHHGVAWLFWFQRHPRPHVLRALAGPPLQFSLCFPDGYRRHEARFACHDDGSHLESLSYGPEAGPTRLPAGNGVLGRHILGPCVLRSPARTRSSVGTGAQGPVSGYG